MLRTILQHFTLTFLVLALIAAGISVWRRARPLTASVMVEDIFAYFLLCSVGMSFFYNFVVHVFFGPMAAQFIGWYPSPFQAEVGMASLGYAVIGVLAYRGGFGLRTAAEVGPAIALSVVDGGDVLASGQITCEGLAAELRTDPALEHAYLGTFDGDRCYAPTATGPTKESCRQTCGHHAR